MLERKPSLTDQVKAHIKQRILNGEFEGERIPPEMELASDLGVSRTTVRDALSRLAIEGMVYRKQGSGTYVNEPVLQIKTRLEEIWSYEAVLQAHGYQPSTRILEVATEPAGEEMAEALQVPVGTEIITVEKLFLEDAKPVIFTVNQMALVLIAEPYEREAWHRPIYEFLAEYGRQRLSYYLSEIIPIIASGTIAATLGIEPGTALLSFSEIGYNDDNLPILKTSSYLRDDLLRLRIIRRKV